MVHVDKQRQGEIDMAACVMCDTFQFRTSDREPQKDGGGGDQTIVRGYWLAAFDARQRP